MNYLKIKIQLPIITLFILFLNIAATAQTVYVSPTGNDANSGTSPANAVQTVQRAVDLATALGSNGVAIEFADGEYFFNATVVLGVQQSGLTFRAAAGTFPVFTSLVQVTGWTTHSGNIMVAPLPNGISHVRYLQDQSETWMERSATPSFQTTEAGGGTGCLECNNYNQSTQADMSNIQYPVSWTPPNVNFASQYDLRATTLPWHQEILPISSINTGQRRIFTTVPALYDLRNDIQEVTERSWVLNSIEGIDTPGEWASLNGNIYLHPRSGTDDIFVPTLTELIRIDDGTADGNANITTPVSNITFDGINFTGGDFRVMQTDDVTAQHDWMVVDEPDALLRIRNAANITVRNCSFERSGGTGLRVDRYAQNIKIYNNIFSFLGRGGINVAGRGPGYGDVSRDNEIAYNLLEYIGMEKWAGVAIMLDNSSNNYVHHNYISDTYFSGIVAVGPRQLMFAAVIEEEVRNFYVGREFHFREVAQSVLDFMATYGEDVLLASQEAMRFVYNYNNRIEENALIDVCTGQGLFLNGQIYISGGQRSTSMSDIKTNYVERNYMYDSFNHSANDYAIYSDSDQDDCNYIGNMMSGILNNDFQPEPTPIILAFNQWAETENEGMGIITVRANVTLNSTFCTEEGCTHTIGFDFIQEGEVINGVGGSATFLPIYEQMYQAICDSNFPQVPSLPGVEAMRTELNRIITTLGGAAQTCATPVICNTDLNLPNTIIGEPITYQASNAIQSQQILFSGNPIVYQATNEILLQPEFSVAAGVDFTAMTTPTTCPAALPFDDGSDSYKDMELSNREAALEFNVFPNPMGQQATIQFDLSTDSKVVLHLTDLNGRVLQTILPEVSFFKGIHQMRLDSGNLETGMYFFVLQTEEDWVTEKVMVVR